MKIAIIGAGAIGVSTAHTLSKAGCEVHVYEQGSSAAQGASFAHAGLFGAGLVTPFFSPQYKRFWLQSLMGNPRQIHWRMRSAVTDYVNSAKALWLSRSQIYQTTAIALNQLATYSDEVRAKALSGKRMEYEQDNGLLVTYQNMDAFESAGRIVDALNENISSASKKIKRLTPEQLYAQEPALSQEHGVFGALYYPSEGYGNCALYTKQLKLRHQKKGVFYWFNKAVTQLEPAGMQWRVCSRDAQGTIQPEDVMGDDAPSENGLYDAVVLAAGAGTSPLLDNLNLRYPVLNLHAYAVTLPAGDAVDRPRCSVLDAATNNTIVPIGNRLRISGQYQVGGSADANSQAYKSLGKTIQQWYPFASKVSESSYDLSSNSIAIDSKPIVGATPLPGLYVNFAHGSQSWPLAFGCAQALTDEIMKVEQRFKLDAFLPQRFN